MIPTDSINKLTATWNSLNELCETLNETQWKTMTACPGWSVQDTLSHLISIEKDNRGDKPTEHRATPRDYVKNKIGEYNEHEVDSRRNLTGAQVFAEWKEVAETRTKQLLEADNAYFDTPVMMPTGPGTVGDFMGIRVLDCWVHEQDIRRALHLPGHESGPAAEHTIDRLIRTLPIVIGKRAATPEGDSVRFVISGPVRRELFITVVNGRAVFVESEPAKIRATFSTDSNTFLTLATGRGTAQETSGKWSGSGDTEITERIAHNLNMMI